MTLSSAITPLLALAAVGSSTVLPRAPTNPGFLSFPVYHDHRVRSVGSLTKRDAEVTLFNISAISYLIELSIGTPGQSVKVAIDTGSNELWVDPNCADPQLPSDQQTECNADGIYNPKKSSTENTIGTTNTIPYGIGEVAIEYVTDDITLTGSSATLKNVQFGVATDSKQLNEGILGIGFGENLNTDYPNFIDELAAQNVTNSKAFSVALGSVDASNGGVVIFGGIDTKKFTGSLITNPNLGRQSKGDSFRYWIQMSSLSLDRSGSTKAYPGSDIPIVLDTGSTFSSLPASIVDQMVTDFGAQLDKASDVYIVPCSQRTQGGTLDFVFGKGTIKIPVADFILQADPQNCVLGALPIDSSSGITALLGDSFMRSVYAVFDQTTQTISLAPYVNCGTHEQAIPATGAASFQGECDATSTKKSAAPGGRAAVKVGGALVAAGIVASVLLF
ncbi:eukaryotic aspartyl protease [Podospora appendiculata]|uniref:Eukaryotic aspartyl protease n=1 Tax=Podospora appendiculata TaxID=314037 RepID=A0AAE0XLF9_9PEZI|nr:eukaryotic aspartyl protease [Podospora appendiculata]